MWSRIFNTSLNPYYHSLNSGSMPRAFVGVLYRSACKIFQTSESFVKIISMSIATDSEGARSNKEQLRTVDLKKLTIGN